MSNQSHPEELLALLLQAWFPDAKAEREYQFAPPRRWRFDFAWPSRRIAIEVEGVSFGRGRHQHPIGFAKDAEKHEAALRDGWRLYRVPSPWISWKGQTRLDEIRKTLLMLMTLPR